MTVSIAPSSSRQALIDWYRRNRQRSRALFDLIDPDAYFTRPIALRNPIAFYEGHLPAFSVISFLKRGLGRPGVDERLETLFARGIDPESEQQAVPRSGADTRWPSRAAILEYARAADDEIVAAILEARRRHPSWGGKKLLALVHRRHPRWDLPHRSTVCEILSRHGMVPKRRARRRIGHPGKPTSSVLAPNDCWSADFKGQFKTGNGRYCYPLTVTDGFSRYLLGCQGLHSTSVQEAKPVFTRLFKDSDRWWDGACFQRQDMAALCRLASDAEQWISQQRALEDPSNDDGGVKGAS